MKLQNEPKQRHLQERLTPKSLQHRQKNKSLHQDPLQAFMNVWQPQQGKNGLNFPHGAQVTDSK